MVNPGVYPKLIIRRNRQPINQNGFSDGAR
jgi:hypothetical protein